MTATELQRLARRLSNQCFCRHWLNLNHPHYPRLMAISAMEGDGSSLELPFLEKLGFERRVDSGWIHYTIVRTFEDGTEWTTEEAIRRGRSIAAESVDYEKALAFMRGDTVIADPDKHPLAHAIAQASTRWNRRD